MSDLFKSIEALRAAIIENDNVTQQKCFQQIDLAFSDIGEVPDDVLNALLQIMEDQKVLSAENSASLFKLFEYNHDLLTDLQRASLWTALCKAFPSLIDSASLILVAELAVSLGDSPQRVFEAFKGFMRITNDTARALLPYAFKTLAKSVHDTQIHDQCKMLIETMKNDAVPSVRNEAERAAAMLV